MGYCFVTVQKVKTLGALGAKYNHNYRKAQVDNADPALINQNEELLALPKVNGEQQMNYVDFFHKRFNELPYYQDHKFRSNQNCALEVVTTFSRGDQNEGIDLDAWKEKQVEWLKEYFNKAGDGKNNIASVMFHADEPGNVHCHAIIIPVDDKGHINARFYTGGAKVMSEMQSSYAKEMKEFGLERGLKGGQASHKQIRKYYADLNRSLILPDVIPFESGEEYRNRCLENIQTLQAAAKRERDLAEAESRRRIAEERVRQRAAIANELARGKAAIEQETAGMRKECAELRAQASEYAVEIKAAKQLTGLSSDEIVAKCQYADHIQHKINELEQTEPDKAEFLQQELFQDSKFMDGNNR